MAIKSLKKLFSETYPIIGLYAVWIIIHYSAAHLYTMHCTPLTFFGFITSPFTAISPVCHSLRWCISHGANAIQAMWIAIAVWIANKLLRKH
jgi:hypothetical protein